MDGELLWNPSSRVLRRQRLTDYAAWLLNEGGDDFRYDYAALHRWSTSEPGAFWTSLLRYSQILFEGTLEPAVVDLNRLPGASWFPGVLLNYAENLLRWPDAYLAVVSIDEAGRRRELRFSELRTAVADHQDLLLQLGVVPRSSMAAVLPNVPEAVVAMLASTGLGATWCSVSPDFGTPGILDRLQQVSPKILYVCLSYRFNDKCYDITDKVAEVINGLPEVEVIVVGGEEMPACLSRFPRVRLLAKLETSSGLRWPRFVRLPFNHPLFVLFTSGTTGLPKAIVHSAGGTLLQLVKEHTLHCDIWSGDRIIFPTTLGWMMWNWQVTALGSGACIILYDGSPSYPDAARIFTIAAQEGLAVLGLPCALLEAGRKANLDLRSTHDLTQVRLIFAGGSVLSAETHRYVSERMAPGVKVASCSGGTDIISCFLLDNPWGPVRAGELSAAGLGMAVSVFDDTGEEIFGRKGELVCTVPAPSMPIGFLNDPKGLRFQSTYFKRFANVWAHGDFAERMDSGGFVIHGRSDTVLNPGGVRIGTAEIYRQIALIDEVLDSVVTARSDGPDVHIVLFVKLAPGAHLDEALCDKIRKTIRRNASPRHVPKVIMAVPDIPKTRSGKTAEIAVRSAMHGETVSNIESLVNPEALRFFRIK